MSTITLTLVPNADGTLHLPLPLELRRGLVKVTATVEPVGSTTASNESRRTDVHLKGFGSLKGKIWMSDDFDEPVEDFKEYME